MGGQGTGTLAACERLLQVASVVFALPKYWAGTVGCLGCRGGAGCQSGVVLYKKALGTIHHVLVVMYGALPICGRPREGAVACSQQSVEHLPHPLTSMP